jgi:ribonuclease PH
MLTETECIKKLTNLKSIESTISYKGLLRATKSDRLPWALQKADRQGVSQVVVKIMEAMIKLRKYPES